jgi:hypothetical protein
MHFVSCGIFVNVTVMCLKGLFCYLQALRKTNRHIILSIYLNIYNFIFRYIINIFFYEKKMSELPLHYLKPVKKIRKKKPALGVF